MQKQNRKRYSGGTKQLIKQTVINVIFKKTKTKTKLEDVQSYNSSNGIYSTHFCISNGKSITIFICDGLSSLEYLFLENEIFWSCYNNLSKGTNIRRNKYTFTKTEYA